MSDEHQTRGKRKLSEAMAVVKELRAYDEAGLSLAERQALAKFNVPARVLVGNVGSYESAKAERQAWERYHFPSKHGSFLAANPALRQTRMPDI